MTAPRYRMGFGLLTRSRLYPASLFAMVSRELSVNFEPLSYTFPRFAAWEGFPFLYSFFLLSLGFYPTLSMFWFFSLIDLAFCILSKNLCLTQGHNDFLLFSSKRFVALAFAFKSIIHFDLTSVCKIKIKVIFVKKASPIVVSYSQMEEQVAVVI